MLPCVFQYVFHMYRYIYPDGFVHLKLLFAMLRLTAALPVVCWISHTHLLHSCYPLWVIENGTFLTLQTVIHTDHTDADVSGGLSLFRAHVDKLQFLPFRRLPSIHFVYLQNTCITHPTSEPSRESLNSHLMSSESSLSPLGKKRMVVEQTWKIEAFSKKELMMIGWRHTKVAVECYRLMIPYSSFCENYKLQGTTSAWLQTHREGGDEERKGCHHREKEEEKNLTNFAV